jgi:hypothetical protein
MYTDETFFARGKFSIPATLTTAQEVVASTNSLKVAGGVIIGGAAAHSITFRSQDGATTYFVLRVPANVAVPIPSFTAESGLEIISGDAFTDASGVITYVKF